eukprot:3336711-Rhodomonas_salina.3
MEPSQADLIGNDLEVIVPRCSSMQHLPNLRQCINVHIGRRVHHSISPDSFTISAGFPPSLNSWIWNDNPCGSEKKNAREMLTAVT